jgi:hypothetical protein
MLLGGDARQCVVVSAGGGGLLGDLASEALIAYALQRAVK